MFLQFIVYRVNDRNGIAITLLTFSLNPKTMCSVLIMLGVTVYLYYVMKLKQV